MGLIISAFPGCGKTTATLKHGKKYKILDLDFSMFDKKLFPKNYVEEVEKIQKDWDVIFVSTHEQVRRMLGEHHIPYILYVPNVERKGEFLELYETRNSNKEFIKSLDNNFECFIDSCKNDTNAQMVIVLENQGDFISNDSFFTSYLGI
jgi:hypothetical protein